MSSNSSEQIQAAVTTLRDHQEKPFVTHEWEELVYLLSHDNDPQLRERMYREIDEILLKEPGYTVFRK
jgi:hypothetical protein